MPGCCSSFTVLPPAVFCPRPSCQVRFPPGRRLSWCLKSSGRALYSTAGLQKLKLDAAIELKAGGRMIRLPDLLVTTYNVKNNTWHALQKHSLNTAWLASQTHLNILSLSDDLIMKVPAAPALLKLSSYEVMLKVTWAYTSSWVIHRSPSSGNTMTLCLWGHILITNDEACRQASKPTQQQVALQHPVIKESV